MTVPFYNDYIIKNKFSRPGYKMLAVKGIVVHYTANPGATADGHKRYFDGADGGEGRYASAHLFVDKDNAVCIIPLDEVAYHANEKPSKLDMFKSTATYYTSGNANLVTIGLEMCIEKDGSFHPDTVKRTQEVISYLMDKYNVPLSKVVRHYDVTGKNCPKPYVESSTAWNNFKAGIKVESPAVNVNDTYKVVAGDYLGKIAIKFDMAVADLMKLNNLKSDLILVGQVLKVKPVAVKVKYLTVISDSLYTYKTANWNDKGIIVKKGDVFTIVDELTVSGSKMYKLKSGVFITANTKYVSVK